MDRRLGNLWRNPNFLKLWSGQIISVFDSQITVLALSLMSANVLQAAGPGLAGMLVQVVSAPVAIRTDTLPFKQGSLPNELAVAKS